MSDYIFENELADKWIELLGGIGDVFRLAFINPVVYRILTKSQNIRSNDSLTNEIRKGLTDFYEAFVVEIDCPSNENVGLSNEDLRKLLTAFNYSYHKEELKEKTVWDIGCGEGYLQRFLSKSGVTGIAVEASEKLAEHTKNNAGDGFTVQHNTVLDFISQLSDKSLPPPNLITLNCVLESLDDPKENLSKLSNLMRNTLNNESLLLVTTLDQEYFSYGIPNNGIIISGSCVLDDTREWCVRSSAHWERQFRRQGFSVLEHHIIHFGNLPSWLIQYSKQYFSESFPINPERMRVSPSQGPFQFWILKTSGKDSTKKNDLRLKIDGKPIKPSYCTTYEEGETVDVKGDLGIFVTEIMEGNMKLESKRQDEQIDFEKNSFLGQMEISDNYYSSRILGDIKVLDRCYLARWDFEHLKCIFKHSEEHAGLTLLNSMIGYLNSTRYVNYFDYTGKKKFNIKNDSDDRRKFLSSISSYILQKCSDRYALLKGKGDKDFISNGILIELDENEFADKLATNNRNVVGLEKNNKEKKKEKKKRENSSRNLRNIAADMFGILIDNSVIDSFSTKIIFDKNVMDNISHETALGQFQSGVYHIGFIFISTALKYREQICRSAEELDSTCIKMLSFAISFLLGNKDEIHEQIADFKIFVNDDKTIKSIFKDEITVNRGNLIEFIVSNYFSDLDTTDSECSECWFEKYFTEYFNLIVEKFSYTGHGNRENKTRNLTIFHDKGISSLIFVREIRPLLTFTLGEDYLLRNPDVREAEFTIEQIVLEKNNRSRFIAYFLQCAEYFALKSGLTKKL